MDTRNWFGEHAATIRMIALGGGIVLAAIIIFDVLAQRGKQQAAASAATAPTTPTDTSATTPGGTLGNGYTDINVFQDYSTHNSSGSDNTTTTSNQYAAPNQPPAPTPAPATHPTTNQGGPVPVTSPHSSTYTVQPGDSLWSIAAKDLGGGYNWTELYNWNRSVIGSNPNLIYPGEKLTLN